MNKSVKIIISILAILLVFGLVFWSVRNRKQQTANNDQKVVENQNNNQNSQNQEEQNNNTEEIDTSDWKTYRNTEYGYELKYPSFLYLNDRSIFGGSANFYNQNKDGALLITVNIINKGASLDDREKINKDTQGEYVITERIFLNNIPTLKTIFSGSSQSPATDEIYFIKNSDAFIISFSVGGILNVSEFEDEILSTFRFLSEN